MTSFAQPASSAVTRAGVGVLALGPALAAAAALWLGALPAELTPVAIVALAGGLAALAWALADLQSFVLVAVLVAMAFPHSLAQPGGAHVAVADVLLLVALGVWLARAAAGGGPRVFLAGNPLAVPALVFAGVVAASVAWSVNPRDTVEMAVQIVEIVVAVTLLYASMPRSLDAVRRGLTAYVAVTAPLGLVAAVVFGLRASSGDVTPLYLGGLHKNALGSFLSVGFVLAAVLSLDRSRTLGARRLLRAAAAAEAVGLAATVSRGAGLGALVGLVTAALLLRRARGVAALLAGSALALFLLVAAPRLASSGDEPGAYASGSVRYESWADGIEKIRERPLLGSGAGTFWSDLPGFDIGLADPNNLFLLTWAELGVLGLLALLFLLWRAGRVLVFARRLPEPAAVLAVAAGAAAVSRVVHFQFDATWTRGTATLCFALIGLMVATVRLSLQAAPRRAEPRPLPPPAPLVQAPPGPAPRGRPLRVLQVVTSDAFAGIERHVLRLARGLGEAGADSAIACPPWAARLRAEAAAAGVPVVPRSGGSHWGARQLGARFGSAWLERLVPTDGASGPDVVHVHDGAAALWARRVATRAGARLVRTQHFVRPASAGRTGWRRAASIELHRSLNARADAIVAVSEEAASATVARGEAPAEALVVIPPGIDVPPEDEVEAALADRRRAGALVIAFVGRLEREKEVDILLRALPAVLARLPTARLVVAGSGNEEPALHALSVRLGVTGSVDWLGEVAEPGPLLRRARVYVNPSASEGFGLATAEAMAWALPVVARPAGASAELVTHGVTGLLAEPDELAHAIVRLAGDRALAERLGAAARARVAARYDAARTVERTLALYRGLAER